MRYLNVLRRSSKGCRYLQSYLGSWTQIRNCGRSHSGLSQDPLGGIRVIDLTRILAGPYCTMILGDLGAEIIKVENPKHGDDTRLWGPPFSEAPDGYKESCYFFSVNRNKKSICINLKSSKGQEILRELVKKSDILVENFVPGTLEKFGLGYPDLSRISPGLIYCSITGFGPDGPYASRAGYDVIAASIGGLMHITGPEDGPPCKVGVALTDIATGLYAHGAVMAALLHRERTGQGQRIDCSLLGTQISTLVNVASNYLNGAQEGKRYGSGHASIVPYQSFHTKDGWMTIGCGNERQFQNFCDRVDRKDLKVDPRFKSNELRVKNRDILVSEITWTMEQKTIDEWNQIFEDAPFPYGAVNTIKRAFEDEQVNHLNMIQKVSNSTQVGPAVRFSGSKNQIRSAPPRLGEHTDEILTDMLGMDENTLNFYRKEEVIK